MPYGKNQSKVFEYDGEFIVNMTSLDIIKHSCLYFGCTYEGRKNGAKEILGAEYKVPIIDEDSSNLIVFPTTSPFSDDCVWISLKRVKNIYKIDSYNTKILFDNNVEIIVPCSFRSVENQLSRASRLDLILRNRKNS